RGRCRQAPGRRHRGLRHGRGPRTGPDLRPARGGQGGKLGIPEAGVGLFAAGGGLLRLPQRVPYGVAMEMALTADPITAEQAFEYGLVTRLAEPGQAVDGGLALAERIARNAPLAVAASKRMIRNAKGLTETEFWAAQRSE